LKKIDDFIIDSYRVSERSVYFSGNVGDRGVFVFT